MSYNDFNDPTGYRRRKANRTEHFNRFVKGWRQRPCSACNGSGRYDHNGGPRCGGCYGTGKELVSPRQRLSISHYEGMHENFYVEGCPNCEQEIVKLGGTK